MRAFFTQDSLRKLERTIKLKQKALASRRNEVIAYNAGGQVIVEKAKSLVRKDTGVLQDSIGVKVKSGAVTVGSDLPYATVSEYKDKPYMRPAIKSEKRKVLNAIASEYKKRI